jgi:hypothetical protein
VNVILSFRLPNGEVQATRARIPCPRTGAR